jgi:hypothetical protein
MIRTSPFRAALLAVLVAVGAFGLSTLFYEGGNGEGWTDGTQGVSNAFWILMILSAVFALLMGAVGVVRGVRSRG